ncbi:MULTISPECIES: hypothetical protein [Morganellaceae]|uniref:DUF2127 domain-containing protein n=1 Tax=Morganella morganii TaxID=582 RepID=A0A9Q4CR32_MORMO|nr:MULTISPECIES: hypothetical protein [Morganellaceae]HCL8674513.1 hypothetical protein [Escherichia coli]ELB3894087.1 hypothetical protein [Morganella morganii]ELB3894663.1 hypothetical protein [Morganella morganii]ELR5110439.1 hypothetical protein [Providencia rettgeri]ELR5110986.1 hypothetical protein [Providencia rettgeri]
MSSTSLFRFVLIAGLIFAIVGVVAGISLSDTLPTILQDYLAQTEGEDISNGEAIFFLLAMLAVLLLLPISTIGLWKFKSWARTLYVVITVAFIPFYPAIGPVVMNGWEAMFSDIALMLEGILLAMMFSGEVSQKFSPSKVAASS